MAVEFEVLVTTILGIAFQAERVVYVSEIAAGRWRTMRRIVFVVLGFAAADVQEAKEEQERDAAEDLL